MDANSIAVAFTSHEEELAEVVIEESGVVGSGSSSGSGEECGICAICLEKILLHETALVKGCEHAYCVTCILRWATYKEKPSCPQCKNPFEFLNLHRSLDGCIHDFMFEESVCLLLRATWFVPLKVEEKEDTADDIHDMQYYRYADDIDYAYDDDDDLEEAYFVRDVPNICIGNRRWGNSGFVRAGRKEARPVKRQEHQIPHFLDGGAGPSRPRNDISKDKEKPKDTTGRRAKRALKREAADKAAAAKHQLHLERLGLK